MENRTKPVSIGAQVILFVVPQPLCSRCVVLHNLLFLHWKKKKKNTSSSVAMWWDEKKIKCNLNEPQMQTQSKSKKHLNCTTWFVRVCVCIGCRVSGVCECVRGNDPYFYSSQFNFAKSAVGRVPIHFWTQRTRNAISEGAKMSIMHAVNFLNCILQFFNVKTRTRCHTVVIFGSLWKRYATDERFLCLAARTQ